MYHDIDLQRRTLSWAFNAVASCMYTQANILRMFNSAALPTKQIAANYMAGAEIFKRMGYDHGKPSFNLPTTSIAGQPVAVTEDVMVDKAFGSLLHFKRDTNRNDPKVLLVAPMSGHYATLLRDTVRDLLPNHDVYITDWKNPRDVPTDKGDFNLEDYITYLHDFIREIGPGVHIAGLSQSTVPVLATTALLAAGDSPLQPISMTLAGGPIDPRINQTQIGKFAKGHSLSWFRDNLIDDVPVNYTGRGRKVYPGVVQFMGLVSMNPKQHAQTYSSLYEHLRLGNSLEAGYIRDARNEYESITDLAAPFYLDTIKHVFQEFSLPRGEMQWKGHKVNPAKICKTALLTLEGEKDDICAPGQTFIAHDLCKGISVTEHFANVEIGAGHYALLNGPRIAGFIRTVAAQRGMTYDPLTEKAIAPTRIVQTASNDAGPSSRRHLQRA